MGGLLGAIAKLGPWASRDTWASVRGASHRFFTHLDCTIVVVVDVVVGGNDITVDAGDAVVGEVTAFDVKVVLCAMHA